METNGDQRRPTETNGDQQRRSALILTHHRATRSLPMPAHPPARPYQSANSEVERRVVSTLLALLDGIGSGSDSVSSGGGGGGGGAGSSGGGGDKASRVVVLAATNRPHALEPALRRPGRLDREIDIGVPDEAGRYEILTVQLKRLQTNAVRVSVDEPTQRHCASVTHGFVGADLQLVCTEALLGAMRQNIMDEAAAEEKRDAGGGGGLAGGGAGDGAGGGAAADEVVVVGNSDLVGAISRVSPSALREVAVEVPKVRWTDVGGQTEVSPRVRRDQRLGVGFGGSVRVRFRISVRVG